MSSAFDAYSGTYRSAVEQSIAGCGVSYNFALNAKAAVLRRMIRDKLGAGARPAMLDVGCGVGAIHPLLQPHAAGIGGVDPSAQCIETARQQNPGIDYRAYDGAHLPYADGSFDVVWASCVLHHVPPAGRDNLVNEMRRVARAGGIVCLIEHNPFNPLTRLAVFRCPFDADAVLLGTREARARLAAAGLTNIACRHFMLLPGLGKVSRSVERACRALPLGAQYIAAGTVPPR